MGEGGKSDEVHSKTGTLATAGGAISTVGGGEGSTFSSPAESVRSMTTTLTTVQSAANSAQIQGSQNQQQGLTHATSAQSNTNQQVQFSHQFPTTPISAVPPHVVPHGHSSLVAPSGNTNVLTDNASVLTLASSSKRRRRNSVDTNASIRALPPSSLFGGSRDSLPLSVLSGNATETSNAFPTRPSLVGHASNERASIYSVPGTNYLNNASERASLHTNRQGLDGASIKSGQQSTHARNDSTPAASMSGGPPQGAQNGRISCRSSTWGDIADDESEGDKREDEEKAEEKSEYKAQDSTVESTTPKKETSL